MENTDTLKYIIALQNLFPNTIRNVRELLEHFPSPEEAFHKAEAEGKKQALQRAEQEIDFITQHHVQTYYYKDTSYPYRLAQCPDAPILLYGKGALPFNQGHMISIVGTRTPTPNGCELCRRLVLDLAARIPDITIISGLAYGIDITAHRAALEAHIPTIIIPGHGLDRIYPSIHRPEAVQSLSLGGILTEYPSGTEPYGPHFVARNRIIAGLADAVVVVESKQKGGSLITAQMAQDYNRDVYTFPGRVHDECSIGCNQLIKSQHAQLIESADDIILAMQWTTQPAGPVQTELQLTQELSPSQENLLHRLRQSPDGIHVNLLVMETSLPYAQICSDLMALEMQDFAKSLPGGVWMARK